MHSEVAHVFMKSYIADGNTPLFFCGKHVEGGRKGYMFALKGIS